MPRETTLDRVVPHISQTEHSLGSVFCDRTLDEPPILKSSGTTAVANLAVSVALLLMIEPAGLVAATVYVAVSVAATLAII